MTTLWIREHAALCKMHISTQKQTWTHTDIRGQVSTATSSPSVPLAKQLSRSFPFKSSPGRTEVHCPIPCVTIPKLFSRTSHDRLLWMCVQTQAERKYLHSLTSYHSFSLFHFQQKKVMVVFPFLGVFISHSNMRWPNMTWQKLSNECSLTGI